MDINQLIADLQEISQKNSISLYKRDRCATAATALSALQAENEKLRAELNDLKDKWDKYQHREHWETLNELCENLHDELDEKEKYYDQMIDALSATDSAELEQVKRERSAALCDLLDVMQEGVGYIDTCRFCTNMQCERRGGTELCSPQWRGP